MRVGFLDLGDEESTQDLSKVFGALSHPSRRAMLARLAKGPVNITEIAAPFEMSLNAVSKHLKVLERAGLIHRRKQGRDHLIAFRGEALQRVSRWSQGLVSPAADRARPKGC